KLIDVAVTTNSRAQQMRIVYLSATGRKYLRKRHAGCYLPPREPASVLRHHNYLAQVAVASFILKMWSGSVNRFFLQYWSSGSIRHEQRPELNEHVPDFYLLDRATQTKYFFELERASTIDRYLKECRAADRKSSRNDYSVDADSAATLSRFFRKIDQFSQLGRVMMIYANPAARIRAQSYFESLLSVGIPRVWKEGKSWRVWEGMYDEWAGNYSNVEWLNLADVVDPGLIQNPKTKRQTTSRLNSRGSAPKISPVRNSKSLAMSGNA
uniref:hypothetical protein n=1 Tax=Fluviibacter phosphoraccumulans TaxID=1751046 RepID=UPI0024E26785